MEWLSRARPFYGPSVDFSRVRVGASRLVLGRSGTAWTCNDVIRFKRARRPEELPSESTLIHELGHVWEHQTGQAQLLRGVIEQIGRRFGRDPYDFGGPEGLREASSLTAFTKEGQAQIRPSCGSRSTAIRQIGKGCRSPRVTSRTSNDSWPGRGSGRSGCPTGLLRLARCCGRPGGERCNGQRRMDGRHIRRTGPTPVMVLAP